MVVLLDEPSARRPAPAPRPHPAGRQPAARPRRQRCASASARPSRSSPPPDIRARGPARRPALRRARGLLRRPVRHPRGRAPPPRRRDHQAQPHRHRPVRRARPGAPAELHPHDRPRLHLSDAGSLYILERDAEGNRRLRFTSSQNDSLPNLELVKFAIPVSKSTLAGYVAATGEPLNIPNVYEIGRAPSTASTPPSISAPATAPARCWCCR
jgi:hypothetical protein